MIKLIKAEFFRLTREKSFYVVLTVAAVFALLAVLLNVAMAYLLAGEETAEVAALLPDGPGELIISMVSLGNAGIFIAIAIGIFIGSDFKDNTIRNKITAGCSRIAIYLSSLIVCTVICVAVFAAISIVTLLFGLIFYGTWFSSGFALEFFLSLLICLAFGCIAVFFAFLTKKSSGTIIIGIVLCVVVVAVADIITTYYLGAVVEHYLAEYNNHAALEWLTRLDFFAMSGLLSNIPVLQGYLDEIVAPGINVYCAWLYANIAITSVVWGTLFTGGGLLLFSRTDIR